MLRYFSSIHVRYCVFLLTTALILTASVPGYSALPLTKDNESPFALIYEKIAPSVVWIEVENEAPKSQNKNFNPRERWERFFDIPIPQQQQKKPLSGMGSGVILDREGNIITNNHVIENADKITVKINEDEEYKAEVVGRDPQSDVAVIKLKLDGKLLPAEYVAELGDSDTLKPGDYAIAIGNPIGLEKTITVGVISGLGRHKLNVYGASALRFKDFIQTDAQINPGNSGGALVDINGKVIGINNLYANRYAGIGFAIPINLAKNIADKLIVSGEVKRGFVGIKAVPGGITIELKDAMGLPNTRGVLIDEIVPSSPAEKTGLEHGDVIITLDGEKIKDFNNFLLKIADHSPGDSVRLGIIRDGKNKSFTLTLADRDDYDYLAQRTGSEHSWRGINIVDLNSQIAQQYDLSGVETGVVVVKIDEGSPAEDVNLIEGDVIIEIESKSVKNVQDFDKIKNEFKDSKKNILIYRLRKTGSGMIKGYVAIKKE